MMTMVCTRQSTTREGCAALEAKLSRKRVILGASALDSLSRDTAARLIELGKADMAQICATNP